MHEFVTGIQIDFEWISIRNLVLKRRAFAWFAKEYFRGPVHFVDVDFEMKCIFKGVITKHKRIYKSTKSVAIGGSDRNLLFSLGIAYGAINFIFGPFLLTLHYRKIE